MNKELITKNVSEHIHIEMLGKMKVALDREEGFCRLEASQGKDLYRLLKRELMDVVYDSEEIIFDALNSLDVISPCLCRSQVRGGYNTNCDQCHGSGYVFSEDFKTWQRSKNK